MNQVLRAVARCIAFLALAGCFGVAQTNPSSSQTKDNPEPTKAGQTDSSKQAAQIPTPEPQKAKETAGHDEAEHGRTHWRLGGISVGAAYSHFPGAFYPFGFYPYGYAPYFYPYFSPYFYPSYFAPYGFYPMYYPPAYFSYGESKGRVKLTTSPKDARVYINGGYAGTADHLKRIWLEPGAYDLMVSAPGRESYKERLYILSGKTVKISAHLAEQSKDETPSEKKSSQNWQ